MNEIKVVRAYCRGCNREFAVKKESPGAFIEIAETGKPNEHHHPKNDCDIVERGLA